ncbi:MAG: 30S ribosomal protein S20 [Planctomycetaceae bacterium]|nr:30S ribosomal protein S20 [Planctomycetaceae bacterium]
MANRPSSKKRIRQNVKQNMRNRWRKNQIKDSVRQLEASIDAGKADQAAADLKVVYKRLDKIAAKGTIHKNTAARRKSRLAKQVAAAAKK